MSDLANVLSQVLLTIANVGFSYPCLHGFTKKNNELKQLTVDVTNFYHERLSLERNAAV